MAYLALLPACPHLLLSSFSLACPSHTSFRAAPWTIQDPPPHSRPFMLAISCLIWSSPRCHKGDFLPCVFVQMLPSCQRVRLVPSLLSLTPFFLRSVSSLLLSLSSTLCAVPAHLLERCSGSRRVSRSQALPGKISLSLFVVVSHCYNSKDAAVTREGAHPCS